MNPSPFSSGAAPPAAGRPRSRRLLVLSLGAALLGVAALLVFRPWASRADAAPTTLASGLPRGVEWAIALDPQRLMAYPVLKRQLDMAPAQEALATVRQRYGLDVAALTGVAFGLRVTESAVEFVLVGELPVNAATLGSALEARVGPATSDVAGARLHRVPLGERLDAYLPPPRGDTSPPDDPSPLPVLPDLLLGAVGEGRVLLGTEGLVRAYLGAGERVADDPELGPRVASLPSGSFVAGAVRAGEGNPLSLLLRRERRRLLGAEAGDEPPLSPDLLCTFELHFEDTRLVATGVYDFADDAAAAKGEAQMQRSFGDVKAQLKGLSLDATLARRGARVDIRLSVKLPFKG